VSFWGGSPFARVWRVRPVYSDYTPARRPLWEEAAMLMDFLELVAGVGISLGVVCFVMLITLVIWLLALK